MNETSQQKTQGGAWRLWATPKPRLLQGSLLATKTFQSPVNKFTQLI